MGQCWQYPSRVYYVRYGYIGEAPLSTAGRAGSTRRCCSSCRPNRRIRCLRGEHVCRL